MVDFYMMMICIIKVITLRYKAEVLLNVYWRFHGMCVWNLHVRDMRLTAREAKYLQDLHFYVILFGGLYLRMYGTHTFTC